MAEKAKIRYGDQFYDRIVFAAYNTSGFRSAVSRTVRRSLGDPTKARAQSHVNAAIATIKKNLKEGLEQSGSLKVSGNIIGGRNYNYSFQVLSKSTLKAKKGRIGQDKYWLDWGKSRFGRDSLRQAISHIDPPKVTYRTKIVGLDQRHGPDRIDFELTLSLSEMSYPLDEMVRRPLLTGIVPEKIARDKSSDKLNVLALLEFGTSKGSSKGGPIPPRPWISNFAAEVGNVMFDDLITNSR